MNFSLVLLVGLFAAFICAMAWSLRRPSPQRAQLLYRLTATFAFVFILVRAVTEDQSGFRIAFCAVFALFAAYLGLRDWQEIRRTEAN